MREVNKSEFKKLYFNLGGGADTGWGLEYWNKFLEPEESSDIKYLFEEPETPQHTRMMIATDYEAHEHRMFLLTQEGEEALFRFPQRD